MKVFGLVVTSAVYARSKSTNVFDCDLRERWYMCRFPVSCPQVCVLPSLSLIRTARFLLQVHGGSTGDADELRLLSNADGFIEFRAHGASLSFRDTKVRRLKTWLTAFSKILESRN